MTAAQRIAMEAAAFHQQQKQQQAAEDDEGAKVAVEGGLDAFLADADEEDADTAASPASRGGGSVEGEDVRAGPEATRC